MVVITYGFNEPVLRKPFLIVQNKCPQITAIHILILYSSLKLLVFCMINIEYVSLCSVI